MDFDQTWTDTLLGGDPMKDSFHAQYLLNQWMDFDQTWTDTLLGGDPMNDSFHA